MKQKICIIGMGYVGTTLGVMMADSGFNVVGVEINPEVVNKLNMKKPHFREKGLEYLLKKHIGKRLVIQPNIISNDCNVYVICVTTPVDENKKSIITYVERATNEISKVVKKGDLIILRSTVPVGVTRNVVIPILERNSGLRCPEDFHVVFASERTIEGKALDELRELPQTIGGASNDCIALASEVFRHITPTIIYVSSLEAAEIVKMLDNTYRDVRFAYSNEIAQLCEKIGLNSVEIIRAANEGYKRNNIPVPSPGVGGACLSKDPYILMEFAKDNGFDPKIIRLSREINEYMPRHMVKKILDHYKNNNKDVKGSKIFVLGFAFKGKPETSDVRDSPTKNIVTELNGLGANVYGYDPAVYTEDIKGMGCEPVSLEQGFYNADCVIIMTNHDSFYELDINNMFSKSNKPCLFVDGWSIFDKKDITQSHVHYSGLGVG